MNSDLAEFPSRIRSIFESTPEEKLRIRPKAGGWSLTEQFNHLVDLEREAWTPRIKRLLEENDPQLPNFDGDAVAKERNYNELPPFNAVNGLVVARAVNVRRLDEAPDLDRKGELEGVGPVTLSGEADLMRKHDAEHLQQINELLQELGVASASS
ncbi:MAG TPA: DinB family protein [Thermoanaerobaculia bacterium]|jgi:uncharacterized damage-inducible protein DinB